MNDLSEKQKELELRRQKALEDYRWALDNPVKSNIIGGATMLGSALGSIGGAHFANEFFRSRLSPAVGGAVAGTTVLGGGLIGGIAANALATYLTRKIEKETLENVAKAQATKGETKVASFQKKAELGFFDRAANIGIDSIDAYRLERTYNDFSRMVGDAYRGVFGDKPRAWDKYIEKFNNKVNAENLAKGYLKSTQKMRDLWGKTGIDWAQNHPWAATALGTAGVAGTAMAANWLWNKLTDNEDEKRRRYLEQYYRY